MSSFLKGRYFSTRDIGLMNSLSSELLQDIIQTEVTLFKMCADVTSTNIYGESKGSVGKTYFPGINITCLIDRAEISTDASDFGPDRKQNVVFKFMEQKLKEINFFPQAGDIILFNARYHQIDDIAQEQFLSGVPEKSFSIICNCHYTRLSSVDIVSRT